MVERRFSPALDPARGMPAADEVVPCLPLYEITWESSYLACDGTRAVCVYTAPDAERVRRAYRAGGVEFVAVWSCLPLHRTKGEP